MSKAVRLSPGQIAAAVTLLAVSLGLALAGGSMFSPGKLNAKPKAGVSLGGVSSHAELGGKCSACHAPPWSGQTMADRCLVCHTDIRSQIDGHQPIHGRFASGMQCRNCHTEHKGEQAAITNLATFDHNCAAFALEGKHTSVACQSCHTSGTYKGTATTCAGCHAEPKSHLGKFGTDCKQCHKPTDWHAVTFSLAGGTGPGPGTGTGPGAGTGPGTGTGAFDHSKTAFPLVGHHTTVACAKCHTDGKFKGTPMTCVSCHAESKSTHLGKFGTNCKQCHTPETWKLAPSATGGPVGAGGPGGMGGLAGLGAAFDHSKTAFPLTGKHTKVDCAKCHVDNKFKGTSTTCVSCHAEPKVHLGKFGTECSKCHTTNAWTGASLEDFKHTFPINHGRKRNGAANACNTCHKGDDAYKTYTCYGCHEHDPARVARQHKKVANLDNCVKCHKGGRGRERERTAADVADDELFAGCPGCPGAGGQVVAFAGGCPHDDSLLLALNGNGGGYADDRLAALLSRMNRPATPALAPIRVVPAPERTTELPDDLRQEPVVGNLGARRLAWLTDPFPRAATSFRLAGIRE